MTHLRLESPIQTVVRLSKPAPVTPSFIVRRAQNRAKCDNRALADAMRACGAVPSGDAWSKAKALVVEQGYSYADAARAIALVGSILV